MDRGVKTIKFRSSVSRSRDTSGHSIINGYRILKELGSGTESSVRLGQSVQSGMHVSIYFQPLTNSKKGFNKHAGRFNYFQLLDKINLHTIPGTRRVLEIWYHKGSCGQLHHILMDAGVTFIDDPGGTTTSSDDTDSTTARTLFLVVEYCNGGGVYPIIGQLYYSEYIAFSRKLSYTIYRLHEAGIIHKDVKIDNILFSKKCLAHNELFYAGNSTTNIDPYLIDFGISIDLDLLNTKIITIDTMIESVGQMLLKDLGQITTLEWFDIEGPVHAMLTQNDHLDKIVRVLVYYVKHFFTIESIRVLADPLISTTAKFITNKNGTVAYLPPEIRWGDLLNLISDSLVPNMKTYTQVSHAFADTSTLIRCSVNNCYDRFESSKDVDDCSSCNTSEKSDCQKSDHVHNHMISQASLIKSTISHSKATREAFKEFSVAFKEISVSNSFYAILPSPIDVWCFGVTILYVMIGAARTEPLYRRSDDVLAISQHLTPFTTDLLCGCLALDPVERYTAEDISRHPLYIGYRVSYEEDNLTTYVSSIDEYRSLFGLPLCCEKEFINDIKSTTEDSLEQTSGNALENYHQYIMRRRRKIIISDNKKHIRRASLSSLESVSHEHIFKEVYTDDTILMTLKLHNSDLFADPWISSVLLQLDLTAISLQVRNSTMHYLHPPDFPDNRSYLVPKFFDVAYTLAKSQTLAQGLLSMKLKYLNYLATRLLGTTVYHNDLTDFKKHIMPEHIRGYTLYGDLVPWVANASADGWDWGRYRRRWGTKILEKGDHHNELHLLPQECLSALIVSLSEISSSSSLLSSSDDINKSTSELNLQRRKRSAGTIVKPPYHNLVASKLQSIPRDVPIFDIQSSSPTEISYGDITEDDASSSQYRITEEGTTTAQQTITCTDVTTFVSETNETHETHETSHDMFPLGLITPSEHHTIEMKMFSSQVIQPPSCDLLVHKSQFLDTALVSHEVVAGRHCISSPLQQLKGPHPKSSNLISFAKITAAKSSSTSKNHSVPYLLSRDTQDQHTMADELERMEGQRNSLLPVSTTRALTLHRSYTTKHPVYDKDQIIINSNILQGEKPRDLQIQKNISTHLNNYESKSMHSTSASVSVPLNVYIGCGEKDFHQSQDVQQIANILTQSASDSAEADGNAKHKVCGNIFNSQTILPVLKDVFTTDTQIQSLVELPNSSPYKAVALSKNQLLGENDANYNDKEDVLEPQHTAKSPSLGALNATRAIRNQLKSAIGDKVSHIIDAYGRIVSSVAPVTVKRVQFHCQRRRALFKESLPKKYNPPLKIPVESQTPSSDRYEQDNQQHIYPQYSTSTSSSIATFKYGANAAISLQTSDSTTVNTDVNSLRTRAQGKTSSTLKQSMPISSINCDTAYMATSTILCSEIDGCNAGSCIEQNSAVLASSNINASPFEALSGAHTSALVYGTMPQEQHIKNTSLKAPSVLSYDHGFSRTYGEEESIYTGPSATSQEEALLFNQPKSTSQSVLSHLLQAQSMATNLSNTLGMSSVHSAGLPSTSTSSSQTNSCQHAKSMTLIELQKSSRLRHRGGAPDAASDSDDEDQINQSSAIASAELATRSACLPIHCIHRRFANALKRRSRGYHIAKILLDELEAQHPTKSQILAPKRLDIFTNMSQAINVEEASGDTSQSSDTVVLSQRLFRSRTFNALIDLSDIESFDAQYCGEGASTQNDKKQGHEVLNGNRIPLKRKTPSLNENIFRAKWCHKDSSASVSTPMSTLPLMSTRNLGAVERVFMEEGAGSLDSSKITRISRYNTNNTSMKRAASYLRNSCASNITAQDTDRLRAFTYDVSDTNNDDQSSDRLAASARLCHFSSGQLEENDDDFKCFYGDFQLTTSKTVESNSCSNINTPIDTLDKCVTPEEKLPRDSESVVHIVGSRNSTTPTNPHKNEPSTLVDSVLSVEHTPFARDEGIPFMNQRVAQSLEASTASYMARDSINTALTCSTIVEDSEKTFFKSDDAYTLTRETEKKHLPSVLSNKIGQGDIEKTRAQIHNRNFMNSQLMTETRWRMSNLNLRRPGDMTMNLSTAIDNPLAKYAEGMPRFLNKFFPFSFTQSIFSSAISAPYRLSGLLFAHYYTHMLPHVSEVLDMFSKHDFKDVSLEYELSISVESAQEAIATSVINHPAPKAIMGSCRTMSSNKVLRPAEVVSKKPAVRTLGNLKLNDFSELFNEISADEETHILELETKDSQYEGSQFLMEDYCSFEA